MAETEPSQGTVYVHRQLGGQFAAGHTLSAEDVDEVQALVSRRDVHMRFLYERELEYSRVIDGITRSPSFRIGRVLTWPA